MLPTTPAATETLTDPVAAVEPEDVGGEFERLDENLHFGRAWQRYRFCYRRALPLRVLDAGCGTGRSSVWSVRLNPGATVLGVDASTEAVAAARERAAGLGLAGSLDFRAHDPSEPLPEAWGRFDFVVCRGLLAHANDPDRLLSNLARALAPDGLLLAVVPSHDGRHAARAFRRAVETLAAPGAGAAELAEVGMDLFRALRPDHPIRKQVALAPHDTDRTDDARLVADLLAARHDWTLDEAAALLARAGLSFLYAATPWRWRPDRVFTPDALPEPLSGRVDRLAPDRFSRLIDALDPSILSAHYQLHACHAGFAPWVPDWPLTRFDDPLTFDRLVPEVTGLAESSGFLPCGTQGRFSYQTVSGTAGELDRWSYLLLSGVDGTSTCAEIERKLSSRTRAGDNPVARQNRWIDLADVGLVLLKPLDQGEKVLE